MKGNEKDLEILLYQAYKSKDPVVYLQKNIFKIITFEDIVDLTKNYVWSREDDFIYQDIKNIEEITKTPEILLSFFIFFSTIGIHIFPKKIKEKKVYLSPNNKIVCYAKSNIKARYLWLHVNSNTISILRHNLHDSVLPIIFKRKNKKDGQYLKDKRISLNLQNGRSFNSINPIESSLIIKVNILKKGKLKTKIIQTMEDVVIILTIYDNLILDNIFFNGERAGYFLHI